MTLAKKEISINAYSSPLVSVHQLSPTTLLCFGPLGYTITSGDTISVNGKQVKKPYLGVMLTEKDVKYTVCMFAFDDPINDPYLESVIISQGKTQIHWKLQRPADLKNTFSDFMELIATLSQTNLRKLLYLFTSYVSVHPAVASDNLFNSHMHRLRRQITEEAGEITRSFWVTPQLAYVETVLSAPLAGENPARLIISTSSGYMSTSFDVVTNERQPSGKTKLVGLAYFPREVWDYTDRGAVILQQSQVILPLGGTLSARHPLRGDILSLVASLPANQRLSFRDGLIRTLLGYRNRIEAGELSALIQMLQHYIVSSPTLVSDSKQPVGLAVEHAFAVGDEGVFISGWLWDPLSLAATLTMQTDVGISLDVTPHLSFHQRAYVNERYMNGPYAMPGYKAGFVAFVPWDDAARNQFAGIARPSHFRFLLQLKNHLHYEVIPPTAPIDVFARRDGLIRDVLPFCPDNAAVHTVLAGLQEQAMKQAVADKVVKIGAMVEKPEVSILVPLYINMDFLRGQIASFSNDEKAKKSEIIFVLDSPEQEQQVTSLLRELSHLHSLPLALVVMRRNGGFAAAVNAGAQAAKGKLLLLMNSDILPRGNTWLDTLCKSYAKQKKIGALGCKLVYENGSIQHAGMYFAKNSEGGYENLHYGKGYPKDSTLAPKSGNVPAVTAAPMLVSKKHFDEVGGFTTDYIIADFEDSDFCLKLRGKGLCCYYTADVEMLHAERQSVNEHPLHDAYITQFNATLHDARWHEVIAEVMQDAKS